MFKVLDEAKLTELMSKAFEKTIKEIDKDTEDRDKSFSIMMSLSALLHISMFEKNLLIEFKKEIENG